MTGFTHERTTNKSVEYYTPAYIFEALGAGERFEFDMDVASPEEGPLPWIPAKRFITPSENGLVVPYEGFIWGNPPYEPAESACKPGCKKKRCEERGYCLSEYHPGLEDWVARMADHGHGIGLLFARTGTKWFHRHVARKASGILLIEGRVRFVGRDGKPVKGENGKPGVAGADSMLVGWGELALEHLGTAEMRGLGARLKFE